MGTSMTLQFMQGQTALLRHMSCMRRLALDSMLACAPEEHRHDMLACASCRAPAVPPVRAAKLVKQAKVTPAALAARLHAQANRLLVKTAAPDDDDILVLSDDASDPDAEDEAAVLADASLSLVGPCCHCKLSGASAA